MIDVAYVFLDANILLHFQPPDQTDWLAKCAASKVYLVIYPLLRKEISRAKDLHQMKHIRKRASDREGWIRSSLGAIDEPIRPGVFLCRDATEPRSLFTELGLERDVHDDMIIASSVSYQRNGKHVFVVTSDGGLEMKLEDHGIRVISLDDAKRLPPERDPEKVRADEAEKRLRGLLNRLPALSVTEIPSPYTVEIQRGLGNIEDYLRNSLSVLQDNYEKLQIKRSRGGRIVRFDTIHNPAYATTLDSVTAFLREQYRWHTLAEGASRFQIKVENLGNLTAKDVRIRIFAPNGIKIYGLGYLTPQPNPPHPFNDAFSNVPLIRSKFPEIGTTIPPIGDGNPSIDQNREKAEFYWPTIRHNDSKVSYNFFITARGIPLGRCGLRVETLCEEIGTPQESHLEIRVIEKLPDE